MQNLKIGEDWGEVLWVGDLCCQGDVTASFWCIGGWCSFRLCDHAFDVIVVETEDLTREWINFELTHFNEQGFGNTVRLKTWTSSEDTVMLFVYNAEIGSKQE